MKVHAEIELTSCIIEDDFDDFITLGEWIDQNYGKVQSVVARTVCADQIMQGRERKYLNDWRADNG